MADFGTNFSGMKASRKLTDEELKRAIRFDIAAEYEAVQLYLQLAESTDNKLATRSASAVPDDQYLYNI